ncbi:hypothetical protein TSOC_008943 [Tetrabaena socialis]|uniref:Uncharacterized protein n=1 Tax=Tetrabaena socialis TaxID=47790 RepID=A0A2J7ZWZ5_9CHLO|nr:hypothetical protein TSOC_008943 [Tetrabaena socialis]|eukprot:PNH04801.1 hypothetical protein TSOC_008943 [Tetrabaena socialis]
MQAVVGCGHAAAQVTPCSMRRAYTPPCSPSTSGRPAGMGPGLGSRRRAVLARSGKDSKDDKLKREEDKADFSAKWALRIKNFFSSRQKYLEEADKGGEDTGQKAFQAEMAQKDEELRKMREEIMERRLEVIREESDPNEPPILSIVAYEYLVPNHFLWAVVGPIALLTWLSGELTTPATPEFWLIAYFGFYRKCWPDVAAWLAANLTAW